MGSEGLTLHLLYLSQYSLAYIMHDDLIRTAFRAQPLDVMSVIELFRLHIGSRSRISYRSYFYVLHNSTQEITNEVYYVIDTKPFYLTRPGSVEKFVSET